MNNKEINGNVLKTENDKPFVRKGEKIDGKFYERRERRIKALFSGHKIRLVGNKDTPMIIMEIGEDSYNLPCYLKNFDLILLEKRFEDKTFGTIKLTDDNCNQDNVMIQLKLKDWLSKSKVVALSKVCLLTKNGNLPLYLIGWNYINKSEAVGRYPVFGTTGEKVYVDSKDCQKVALELYDEGYDTVMYTSRTFDTNSVCR